MPLTFSQFYLVVIGEKKVMRQLMLAAIASLLPVSVALAQNRPLACQSDESAGLDWSNGRWEVTRFNPIPAKFILVQTGESLTPKSVAKVFSAVEIPNSFMPSCRRDTGDDHVFCTDGFNSGQSLIFSFGTMKGSIAKLLGSISANQQSKDSVAVTTFTCQPF